MDRLNVYSDVICPWCFIGKQHLGHALRMLHGDGMAFAVAWRPFQLNPDMPAGGMARDDYRRAKFGSLERSRELDAQVAGAAVVAGVEIRHDLMQRTPNTLDAHRLILLAGEAGRQDAVVDRLFQDYFVNGRDIGDRAILAEAAAAAGMDGAQAAAFLASDAGRADVLDEDSAVRRAGLQGVPTFVLNGRVLFSGSMPADAMADVLARACRVLSARTG